MSELTPVIDYIDGPNRRIYLKQGVDTFHWIEDVYREYIAMRAADEELRKYYPFLRQAGNDPKGGGKYTPRYITLLHGTRVIPYDENILITVTGEAITDDADTDPDPFDTSTRTQPLKLYITPPASELVKAADELAAIKRMAFDNRVAIDARNVTGKATTSTAFPAGTRQAPAADITTALAIARMDSYGFKELFLESGLDIVGQVNLDGFVIEGNNHVDTVLTIDTEALVDNLKIINCTLDNTVLDGDVDISHCMVGSITYLNGHIHDSGLFGTMLLGGDKECVLANCYTIDADNPPVVDMGGSGNDLAMPNYSGLISIRNLSSDTEEIGIGLNAGMVILEDTITAGSIIIAGTGILVNNTTGTAVVNDDALINHDNIAQAVWQYERT